MKTLLKFLISSMQTINGIRDSAKPVLEDLQNKETKKMLEELTLREKRKWKRLSHKQETQIRLRNEY